MREKCNEEKEIPYAIPCAKHEKSNLFQEDNKKHEQNVVKSDLNIIPARDVEMR